MIDTSRVDRNWWEHKYGSIGRAFDNWMGDYSEHARVYFRNKVKELQLKTVLDVGAGKAVDYDGFKTEMYPIEYSAIDITPQFVEAMKTKGIDARLGDCTKLPYLNNKFDVVYARHLLEHLPEIDETLKEMCRVAKRMVCIIFFMPPAVEDIIKTDGNLNGEVYLNSWGRKHIESIVSKYGIYEWVTLKSQEMLLVYKTKKSKAVKEEVKQVKGLSPCCKAGVREEKSGDLTIKICNKCGKVVL